MTGQFRTSLVPKEHRRHHFMTLQWGQIQCHFLDFRRFSRVRAEQPDHGDALGGFHPRRGFYLHPLARVPATSPVMKGATTTPRISWLLRHGKQTGVGNYLANEALGRLNLSPFFPCRDPKEALTILKMCQHVARQSYRAGGTSFGSGYWRLNGSKGRYAKQLRFYQNPALTRLVFRDRSVYSRFSLIPR